MERFITAPFEALGEPLQRPGYLELVNPRLRPAATRSPAASLSPARMSPPVRRRCSACPARSGADSSATRWISGSAIRVRIMPAFRPEASLSIS